MKDARDLMGMPITVEVLDSSVKQDDINTVFEYLNLVDKKFSTYKDTSEISAINRKELGIENSSQEMKEVFSLSDETKKITNGYFDIYRPDGKIDPSGLVKGWAINNATLILKKRGLKDFYIEAGGDIQVQGKNSENKLWSVGIRNPFKPTEIIKIVYLPSGAGMATSGTYIRGQHIYNPLEPNKNLNNIVSLTVIGPNVYEADRFATAAFAMGEKGINFIEALHGFEGYAIDNKGLATLSSGFENYTKTND